MAAMIEYVFTLWGMIIVGIVFGSLATIVGVLAKEWRRWREAELEASLKAELIKQGRSPEEIEKVLRATGRPREKVDAGA